MQARNLALLNRQWVREQLETSKAQLRQAKRTLMAPAFIGGLQAYIDRLDYVVTMWEKTPLGKKALHMFCDQCIGELPQHKPPGMDDWMGYC